jgi:hypothetical protein
VRRKNAEKTFDRATVIERGGESRADSAGARRKRRLTSRAMAHLSHFR